VLEILDEDIICLFLIVIYHPNNNTHIFETKETNQLQIKMFKFKINDITDQIYFIIKFFFLFRFKLQYYNIFLFI